MFTVAGVVSVQNVAVPRAGVLTYARCVLYATYPHCARVQTVLGFRVDVLIHNHIAMILRYTAGIVSSLLALDVFGFVAWVASGQTPVDGFYIGALTARILGL